MDQEFALKNLCNKHLEEERDLYMVLINLEIVFDWTFWTFLEGVMNIRHGRKANNHRKRSLH